MFELKPKNNKMKVKVFINGVPKYDLIPSEVIELMTSVLEEQIYNSLNGKLISSDNEKINCIVKQKLSRN